MKTISDFLAHAAKNWQPSLAGIVVAIALFGGQMGLPPKLVDVSSKIATAFGLLAAKQQNVTGGTALQPSSVAVLIEKADESQKVGR